MPNGTFYTVILEYRGGTYISQLASTDPWSALKEWAKSIPDNDLIDWRLNRDELLAAVNEDPPVPLSGFVNAWCTTGSDGSNGGLILIHIVATVRTV